MERWQMNRLGFVNFWVYDVEEFPIDGGRILLRGANGSGKSITTQSFIPYIYCKYQNNNLFCLHNNKILY